MSRSEVFEKLGPLCREFVESRYLDLVDRLIEAGASVSDEVVEVLRALANSVRLRIVAVMSVARRPLPLCLLAAVLDVDPQTLLYHVRALKEAGLLREMSVGRLRILELDRERLHSSLRALAKALGLEV